MRVLVLLFVLSLFHVGKKIDDTPIRVIQTHPLALELSEQMDVQFFIYNVSGDEVVHWQENQIGPGLVTPDCGWAAMEEGVYFVTIRAKAEEVVTKVVIRGE